MARAPTRGRGNPADRTGTTSGVYFSLPRRKRLSDAEGLELFRQLAEQSGDGQIARRMVVGDSSGPPRMSLVDSLELNSLEKEGFQYRYIEQYRAHAGRHKQLMLELQKADQILNEGDPNARDASLAALNALIQYARTSSAAIEYLRKTLMGGKSVVEAEFEGRLSGLVEVMSWQLKNKGGARAVYGGSDATTIDPTAKKVIELAERFAKRAGVCWEIRRNESPGRKESKPGSGKVRSVYMRVKAFNWQSLVDAGIFGADELGNLEVERLQFLDIVRSARRAQGQDLLLWSLERAKVYFSIRSLPPRAD